MARDKLTIGIFPDVELTAEWPAVRAFLQPAADLHNGRIELDGHQVWTVHDEDARLIAAATTRTTLDGHSEVMLVGGRQFRRWLHPLREVIEAWSRDEGMRAVRAYGRAGWSKVLGWRVLGVVGGSTVYEREL
jgi:hypothetical protein